MAGQLLITSAMLLTTGCATTSFDCSYESHDSSRILCHLNGSTELRTEVGPPGSIPGIPPSFYEEDEDVTAVKAEDEVDFVEDLETYPYDR